jgi:hypothetical protein
MTVPTTVRNPTSAEADRLAAAARSYSNAGVPLLPYQLPAQPDRPVTEPCLTCRRLDCPAPPLHTAQPLSQPARRRQADQATRWWATNPHSAIASLTGCAFDIAEIHTTIPPDTILAWLTDQHQPTGPVLHAGHGRLQFLAKPHSYQPDRCDSATTAVLYLAAGTLILLPPSHLPDGQPITWLRPLGDLDRLPDGDDLFWSLVDLPPDRHQAPDPSTYVFHTPREHHHDTP